MIGEPNGAPVVRARPTLGAYGLHAYEVGWFTGTGVEQAVAGRTLELDE